MADDEATDSGGGHKFGTFAGVFTPSILTIFGLIMFMRANYVVGNAGVYQTLVILGIAGAIVALTGLSISAISSNTPVGGGGAYFLISRVLGPAFGTSIGIAFFAAQALSVPFYVLGFTEALVGVAPEMLQPHFRILAIITLVVLFVLAFVGADWAIKTQFVILGVLAVSMAVFIVGSAMAFDPATLKENLNSSYSEGQNFWSMFAIYFPAVTGIMAGVNMSGDLKDPAKSIPRGTLAAVGLSVLVYGGLVILGAGLASAVLLREQPFELWVQHAWLGLRPLVIAGVFAATLSSAIGSYLGAPRVLQAVARDRAIPMLNPFSVGTARGDEPRRALWLTLGISIIVVIFTGGGEGGAGLNLVAGIVSMVFLFTYGMTNLAAFVESFGSNPSFRPRFTFFHWTTALTGAIACVWCAFQIDPLKAAIALAILTGLFYLARAQKLTEAYGDARRGFLYQRVRNHLIQLSDMPPHPKNWRPTILVLSGSPHYRLMLVTFSRWFGMKHGIVTLAYILQGDFEAMAEARREEKRKLDEFVNEQNLDVLTDVVVLGDFDREMSVLLQAHSLAPIKSNVVVLGWMRDPARITPYFNHLRTMQTLGMSYIVVIDRGLKLGPGPKRIDCWWRGQKNGSLMIILAHLLMLNEEWRHTELRLLRQVASETEVADAMRELREISDAARVAASFEVSVSTDSFAHLIQERSGDATLVMLGTAPPAKSGEAAFFDGTQAIVENLPTTLLVYSSGDADLGA